MKEKNMKLLSHFLIFLAAINPGDKCTDSNDCSIFMSTNSFCENNTCTCRAGYHFAKQIGKCLVNKSKNYLYSSF